MTAPPPLIWPSPLHCVPLQSLTHHRNTKPSHHVSGFPSPVSFPPQLQRTIAINGLHSTPTDDLPRPLTSRRPRPIKGTLGHRLHTTFPFLASGFSICARIALPSSSIVALLFPTIAGSPPAVHYPAPPSVRTTPLPLPLGSLAASSLGRDCSCTKAPVSPWHRAAVSPCGPIECRGPWDHTPDP
jgi:hypothetical protein